MRFFFLLELLWQFLNFVSCFSRTLCPLLRLGEKGIANRFIDIDDLTPIVCRPLGSEDTHAFVNCTIDITRIIREPVANVAELSVHFIKRRSPHVIGVSSSSSFVELLKQVSYVLTCIKGKAGDSIVTFQLLNQTPELMFVKRLLIFHYSPAFQAKGQLAGCGSSDTGGS